MCDCVKDLLELARLEQERQKLTGRIIELKRKTFAHELIGLSKAHPPDGAVSNVY